MAERKTASEPVEDRLLTSDLLKLVQDMAARFGPKRKELLEVRQSRLDVFRSGTIERLEDTKHIREAVWRVDPVPVELLERRVELIGGCSRQELIEGMNAGAKSYVADLWNMSPTDPNGVLRAHKNLERVADNRLQYVDESGDRVRVNPQSTTRLFFVPRPLHTTESSVRHAGEGIPAAFFDLAVYASYNAVKLRVRQAGVYLYLRGVQSHQEARLWRALFEHLEEHLHLPRGTFRATVFMDSLAAVLEAEEILFELTHHSAGLSLDPQAYAADHLALFSAPERAVMPDRERIGLNEVLLRSVSLHVISVCHRRQAHAIGAPAFILPPDDKGKVNAGWLEMIADKEREAVDGHDGTIVGHPGLVNSAMMEFNKSMPKAHQMYYERNDTTTIAQLVQRPEGSLSTDSLLGAVRTVLRALVQREQGDAVIVQGGRLHDRSSVRLSSLLLWSWTRSKHGFVTDTGLEIHDELMTYLIKKEATKLYGKAAAPLKEASDRAVATLCAVVLSDRLPPDLLG